ncbi:MAG: class I SAM-dependent methyltransferase [Rhodanobacteraceae bacterium]|nr:class I SAM-dependent methyltransferase [Rhodanobacteraceae bacterium]
MSAAYDAIASIYDADMGASMAFDDIGWYRALARAADGPVLELGCGTGRVLAALLAAGVDAVGVDRSGAMLQQARLRCGPAASLLRMDIRRLALRGEFALALLPYSLATYLLDEDDWSALATGLRATLRQGACVVVDAFIPQPRLAGSGWLRDYARRVNDQWLVRHKRVMRLADGCHRIERRYRMRGAFGGRTLVTREVVRPHTPERLVAQVRTHLGPVLRVDYDYAPGRSAAGARFCSVVAGFA